MKFKIILISLILLLFGSAFHISFSQDYVPQADKEYIISTGNMIEVTVYGEPDLSITTKVSQDGTFNYPLIGNIKAAGLTIHELETDIAQMLEEDYLVNPQVTVAIREYAKISIFGAVKNPGSYQMKERFTLTQAVALAGGFRDEADTSKVKIMRVVDGKKETFQVDADSILNKAAPDIEIKPDDTIIVEEYGRISIIGQVVKPGIYKLEKGLTALEAISLAGGFTSTAAPNGTRVIRVQNDKKVVMRVPVAEVTKDGDASKDILLEAGDTIVVPESFF